MLRSGAGGVPVLLFLLFRVMLPRVLCGEAGGRAVGFCAVRWAGGRGVGGRLLCGEFANPVLCCEAAQGFGWAGGFCAVGLCAVRRAGGWSGSVR